MVTVKKCPYCQEEFSTTDPRKIYCSPAHSQAAANARRASTKTPEEREEASLERKLLSAQVARKTADREAAAAKTALAETRADLEAAHRELGLYQVDYTPRPEWSKPPGKEDEHHGTLLAFFSDPHWGEEVRPDEMDGYNAYDLGIAELRTRRFFEKTIMMARDYLAGVKYDGLYLVLGGDLVSGDIHDELEQTNLLTTYETVEWAVPKLAAGIEMLAEEFGNVHVVSVPGNHGRNTRKPRHKRRSANNADTHIARILAWHLAGEPGVTFDVPAAFDARFEIYGSRFSVEHGDAMRFGGTSEIGSIGPVKRGTLRKGRQAQTEGHPFDYLLIGHFHQYAPVASQGFVMNGSMKGYDEFARAWKFTPEPAQQALMVVTPEHGITVQAPVLVQDRDREGW